MDPGSVSVILPVHNEEANISEVIRSIRAQLGPKAEILVVDDASSDQTVEMARSAGADRLIPLSKRSGKGMALREGMLQARGEYWVLLDGDGQDPPEEIPKLLEALKKGHGLVIGSRFLGRFFPGSISLLNRWATCCFNILIRWLFGLSVTDSQAGFRALKASRFRKFHFKSLEYEIETEILLKAVKGGIRIKEIGVGRYPRASGRSSFRRIRHGLRILLCILRERWAR